MTRSLPRLIETRHLRFGDLRGLSILKNVMAVQMTDRAFRADRTWLVWTFYYHYDLDLLRR